MGNSEPVFVSRNLDVQDVRKLGKDASHLKLTSRAGDRNIEAIGFGMGELEIDTNSKVDIAFTIDINEWRDRKTLQLKIKDIKNYQ